MNYDVFIPIVSRNISILKINIPYIRCNVCPKRISVVGRRELKSLMSDFDEQVVFIDENELLGGLTFEAVEKLISSRDSFASARAGWYFQQFLKMAYAEVCQDDFYFTLDADTIPVRKIDMFDENASPFFDLKTEFNPPYFTTLKKLIGLSKVIDGSFISEHMIFKTEYMRTLIRQIEENNCLEGKAFFEKIINAVNSVDLLKSGFSEFETYGTFVVSKYPDKYKMRTLKSLRQGDKFLGLEPYDEMLEWAAESYDFISFENRKAPNQRELDYVKENMSRCRLDELVKNF